MSKWFKGLIVALLLPALAGAAGTETFHRLDGEPVGLEAFLGGGKWVVVTVWASDCQVCNREIHEMVAFHAALRGKDAAVLGISVDGPDDKAEARVHRAP
ncbi:MAG: TlpA family protein disulfide reductase [Gammaproteobacteria bacterium]|nr:TlpA family protein disulfide reductase [Gammaproteobacteria bacterium]